MANSSTWTRNAGVGLAFFALIATAMSGCLGAESQGHVAFFVKDAPVDDLSSVFVTFSNVEVHRAGSAAEHDGGNETQEMDGGNETAEIDDGNDTKSSSWKVIVNSTTTVDLLNFTGDASAFLGEANITTGKYTQIRITVDEAWGLLKADGSRVNLTIPSGKLKIVSSWTVEAGKTTVLTVDFLLDKSIHKTGNGEWKLKPVLKLITEKSERKDVEELKEKGRAAEKSKGKKPVAT
jgi:hypothetical protein